MRNLHFLKLIYGLMLVMISTAFVSCVDDNEDTEAPFLKVSLTTLSFEESNGQPSEGGQDAFEISTNRKWRIAIAEEDKNWVTLSQYEGEGSARIQVSVPGGEAREAIIAVEMFNKVGPLMSENVTIKRGQIVPATLIYKETFGTKGDKDANNRYPFVDQYDGWEKSGEGSATVTYKGKGASLRKSGKLSEGYEGASGSTKLFFGANAEFEVQKITLKESQTNLRLTFGGNYSKNNNGTYDNEFKPEKFHFYLSADGEKWSAAVPYEAKKANDFWVFATANFTLGKAVETLYIKFAADEASVFSIDDVTLVTGNGGTVINMEAAEEPATTTTDATSITETSATLGGTVSNVDESKLTEVGVEYIAFSTGTVTGIDWTKAKKVTAPKATAWTVAIKDLSKDTQYAYRAFATTASGTFYGETKTFVATAASVTPIAIADLVKKMTETATAVDKDYTIEGIICGDPAGKNYAYGTLYVMTKGATSAGNALSLYNNKIDVTKFAMGQEIKVTLKSGTAKIQKRFDTPQVEGFTEDDIQIVSANNPVDPVKVTVDQLASFVCMPVTIADASTDQSGTWKDAGSWKSHTFKAGGQSFAVYINKQAVPFEGQSYSATTGDITGIVSIFKGAGQIAPRNLDDVKAFASAKPVIVSATPSSIQFPSTGGNETITLKITNQGSNELSQEGLSGILSARIEGERVIVTAKANESNEDVTQSLTIRIANGNSIIVPVKVSGKKADGDTKGEFGSMTPFLFENGVAHYNAWGEKLNTDIYCLKLGTSSKTGSFTTGALGVTGDKKLSFYAVAWKGKSAKVYIRVNNAGSVEGGNMVSPASNEGATKSQPYTITFTDADYYTLNLKGLTEASTITISTDQNFSSSAVNNNNARTIMCGFQLY